MRKADIITRVALMLCAVVATGCVGNNYCAKRQECNNDLEDDSYGVCVESYSGNINALRANKEEECHVLADALLAARERTLARFHGGSGATSRPSSSTWPVCAWAKPAISLRSVVLPQPDGPRKAKNSPGWIERATSFSTCVAP